jgi:hypothetical protein
MERAYSGSLSVSRRSVGKYGLQLLSRLRLLHWKTFGDRSYRIGSRHEGKCQCRGYRGSELLGSVLFGMRTACVRRFVHGAAVLFLLFASSLLRAGPRGLFVADFHPSRFIGNGFLL